MKPDPNNCLNCNKEISNKAKYCSDKCRMAYARNPNKSGVEPEQKGEHTNPNTRDSLTKTDQTFYDRAMKDFGKPYYKFESEVHEEKCLMESCSKTFKTNLKMLRFCSYEHYSQALSGKN